MENYENQMFSLEDDDANELFITQTPSENISELIENTQEDKNVSIFGDGMDFKSPCASFS